MLLWLVFACARGTLVAEPSSLTVAAEPGADAIGELVITNETRETVVIDAITFEPADLPATWGGDGPWTLPPGGKADVRVLFRPEGPGEWDGRLVIGTTIGGLPVPLALSAAPGADGDGDGWSTAWGDCDDADPDAFPGRAEGCDGVDNDCDGAIDEDFDQDGDGHRIDVGCEAVGGDDCDDGDATAHAGHVEDCDGTDSDCNGVVDDTTEPADLQEGLCAGATKVCDSGAAEEPDYAQIAGYEPVELSCDGLDNDCDGQADGFDRSGDGTPDCVDDDGDGATEAEGDCDDADASRGPADCGPWKLVVTSTDVGFTTVDLNLRAATTHPDLGIPTYDAAAADGAAWLTDRAEALQAVDPLTGATGNFAWLRAPTWGVVHDAARELVWVASEDGQVQGLDPVSLATEVRADVGILALGIALDGDGLWVCGGGQLWWVDAETGDKQGIPVGVDCYGAPIVDADRDRVLVLGYLELELVAVDRATRAEVARVPLADRAIRGQLAAGSLWLATGVDGGVTRMDPASYAVLDRFAFGEQVGDVWLDESRGDLWVTLPVEGEILRADPATGAVRDRLAAPAPFLIEPLSP